jgi:hypothetical protein
MIIREELLREQAGVGGLWGAGLAAIYGGEESAKDLDAAGTVKYGAARAFLGATPAGAAEVAHGRVKFEPTTYWGLQPAQKAFITGGLADLTAYSGYLSMVFPPAAVVTVASGIVGAVLKMSDGDVKGAITDLLGSILVALLATGKLAELLTRALGAPVANLIGKDPRKFLRNVFGDGTTLMPEIRQALARLGGATNLQASLAGGYRGSAIARGAGLALKAAISEIFGLIDDTIANLIVAMATRTGRQALVAKYKSSYQSLKQQALALLDDVTNPTLIAALTQAEGLV